MHIRGRQLVFHACTDGHATRQVEVGGMLVIDASYPAGTCLASHDHPRRSVVLVLHGGFRELTNGTAIEVRKGMLYLSAPTSHAAHEFGNESTRCLVVEMLTRPDVTLGTLSAAGLPMLWQAGRCGRIGVRIARLPWDDAPANRLRLESLLLELLACVASRNGGTSEEPPEWLRRVHDELCERFREPPSLVELAASAGVHQGQLLRRFRRHYGMSPTELVRRWKAEHARALLAQPGASLSAVAFAAGFADQSHMGRVLRRVYGTTPRRLQQADIKPLIDEASTSRMPLPDPPPPD